MKKILVKDEKSFPIYKILQKTEEEKTYFNSIDMVLWEIM